MNAKEALLSIKNLLKTAFADDAPAVETGKLSDGTVIEYSKLEAGGDISIVGADGAKTPAPAGEMELEDGRIIVVTEAGKIAEVKDAAAEPAQLTEEQVAAAKLAAGDPPAEGAAGKSGIDWSERIKDMQRQLAWQAESIASLKNAMQTFKADTKGVLTSTLAFMEEVAAQETGAPINQPKQTVFTENKKKKEEALAKTQASFKAFSERLKETK